MSSKKPNYAFIDSQNLNMGVQKMGWKMDWRRFRNFLSDEYGVEKAYMFIGHIPEHEDMYLKMHEYGFLVVLKPTFDMTNPKLVEEHRKENKDQDKKPEKGKDEEEKKPVKGNVDADLVLWVMKEYDNYDKAVVISGDGDFYGLYEHLEEQGKLLHIMAPNWQYSQLLNKFKDYIVRIDHLKPQLMLRTRRK